jgi:hypothetical protein
MQFLSFLNNVFNLNFFFACVTFILRNIFYMNLTCESFSYTNAKNESMFLTWKPRTNTTCRRRPRWRRSSTTRKSLTTVSSTFGSSPTWLHAPLWTTNSGATTAWARSRAATPRCPSSSRATSWSSPTSVTPGLFWAPHPTTAPSHRPAHRPPKAQPAT